MGNCLSSDKSSDGPSNASSNKQQSSASRVPASKEQEAGIGSNNPAGAANTGSGAGFNNQQLQNNSAGQQPNGTNSQIPGSGDDLKPNYSLNNTNNGQLNNTSDPNNQNGSSSASFNQNGNGQTPNQRSQFNSIVSNNTTTDNSVANSRNGSASQSGANGTTATSMSSSRDSGSGKRPEVKILLLGAGESGKSTILKQMKIIHQSGYSQDDLLMYKTTVYKNLLDCAKTIVEVVEQFHVNVSGDPSQQASAATITATPTSSTENQESSGVRDATNSTSSDTTAVSASNAAVGDGTVTPAAATPSDSTDLVSSQNEPHAYISKEELDFVKNSIISPDPDSTLDPKLTEIIFRLWAHPAVKNLLATRRSEFYIMDSAQYFFRNVQRIGDPEYIPTVADILRARIKTTGIYETQFSMGQLNIHMYDVGGQRSERKKWIHCFDNVTLIIFCVALSDYDQVLLEETTQNRMAESLVLFESIINSRWFTRTTVVLFLNKIDIFTEKLPVSPLENYFPDYTGGNNIKKAAKYILWRFTQLNRNNLTIYPHITQATDTSNIRLVFAAVKESILENSLRDSGLL